MRYNYKILLLLFVFFLHSKNAWSVKLQSDISEKLKITAANSPCEVYGVIRVLEGAELSFESGVEVILMHRAGFIVNGTLLAIGEKKKPIIFRPYKKEQAWKNISFVGKGSSGSIIRHCVISGGTGNERSGGAISCNNSSPEIASNKFVNNTADFGGGISCANSSSPRITGNIIKNNNAHDGGGIYCYYSSPEISGNTISGNTAESGGGGIKLINHSFPNIVRNFLIANKAALGGGIIAMNDEEIDKVRKGIFQKEKSNNAGKLVIKDNFISENNADEGGGLFMISSSGTIENNRITRNSARISGGGILVNSLHGWWCTLQRLRQCSYSR